MPHHDIPLPFPTKPKANPGQIREFDNRDDRLEIATLLKHLPPWRRLRFLEWACSQAILPCSRINPKVARSMYELADRARSCDRANASLTMHIIMDLSHMWIDYALDASACLRHLVLMARGRDAA